MRIRRWWKGHIHNHTTPVCQVSWRSSISQKGIAIRCTLSGNCYGNESRRTIRLLFLKFAFFYIICYYISCCLLACICPPANVCLLTRPFPIPSVFFFSLLFLLLLLIFAAAAQDLILLASQIFRTKFNICTMILRRYPVLCLIASYVLFYRLKHRGA